MFAKVNILAGSNVYIERDYSLETRKKMRLLLSIRRIIRSKLVDNNDKAIRIKVMGNRMDINRHQFSVADGQLMCGNEMGVVKLNSIFKADFDENSFIHLNRSGVEQ